MKLNLRQGFFRICVTLSGLVLVFGILIYAAGSVADDSEFWPGVLIVAAIPWVLYWIGVYIGNGFVRK